MEVLPLELTQERLKELLHYDPHSGLFTWKVNRGPAREGAVTGSMCSSGYLYVRIDDRLWRAHRLAFLYVTGSFPPAGVDHINGCRSDNRWENLRPADQSQNSFNRGKSSNNKTTYKGVSLCSRDKRYVARIGCKGVYKFLGRFDTPEEAAHAYNCAAIQLHGEFAVLNPIGDK